MLWRTQTIVGNKAAVLVLGPGTQTLSVFVAGSFGVLGLIWKKEKNPTILRLSRAGSMTRLTGRFTHLDEFVVDILKMCSTLSELQDSHEGIARSVCE